MQTRYSLLTTRFSLLTAHYSHYSLLITHCSLLTAHYSLPTTLTTHYSLLTHDFNDDRPSRPGHASQAVLTLSNRADFIEGIFLSLTYWIQVVVA